VARRVEVGPLGLEAVRQLASEVGRAGLADSILRRTGGHTFFVVESLRALAGGDEGLPESLVSAVQARVRGTGAAAEKVLRAAAVLGATVDPLALSALLDLTPVAALELCEVALDARLLVISGRDYEFANDLIREALYASTPEPTRLAYHRRATGPGRHGPGSWPPKTPCAGTRRPTRPRWPPSRMTPLSAPVTARWPPALC